MYKRRRKKKENGNKNGILACRLGLIYQGNLNGEGKSK